MDAQPDRHGRGHRVTRGGVWGVVGAERVALSACSPAHLLYRYFTR